MLCVESVTVQVVTTAGQPAVPLSLLAVSASQPTDVSGCTYVAFTGAEAAGLGSMWFPTTADAGTAWTWGFSVVVLCYLFAWAAGSVLSMLDAV